MKAALLSDGFEACAAWDRQAHRPRSGKRSRERALQRWKDVDACWLTESLRRSGFSLRKMAMGPAPERPMPALPNRRRGARGGFGR